MVQAVVISEKSSAALLSNAGVICLNYVCKSRLPGVAEVSLIPPLKIQTGSGFAR